MQKRKLTPFGLSVKNRLADMNMTQKELANRLGTSDAYLSMILYGERAGTMYIASIKKILDLGWRSAIIWQWKKSEKLSDNKVQHKIIDICQNR